MIEKQQELVLPPPNTDDILRERLASRVEEQNAEVDPLRRVELHSEIQRLRALLRRVS